ncbi:pilin [Candidatus Nomurabacteria bacterium]|jgi:threonine/homoserine/homoserine lactone efflux protein|nr:pilin [Candidatus Nomurabacteria bacterium]
MKKIISIGAVLGVVAPLFAHAASAFTILTTINQILATLIPILITLAVVYFIWGVIQYLVSGDEEKKKSATEMIIRGLVGLFIIIAFWGIIRLITNTFGVGPEQINSGVVPCIPGPGVVC